MLEVVAQVAQIFAGLVIIPVGGFAVWRKIDKRLVSQDLKLAKIDYALFNAGKTGLVNKADTILENQGKFDVRLSVLEALGE